MMIPEMVYDFIDRMVRTPGQVTENLFSRLNRFVKIYLSHMAKPWLGPEPRTWLILVSATVLIALSLSANVYVRYSQLQVWKSENSAALIFNTPSFSTADAPYFLKQAATVFRDGTTASYSALRSFPTNSDEKTEPDSKTIIREIPLLSVLIATFSSGDDPASLLATGNLGILVTSALTAVAVAVCFGASGYWIQGAIASLGGGLSAAYLIRSSIGRIDTDQLNLGFMYLMFGLVVFAGRASSRLWCFAWCVAAGLSANLFMWWYGKSELIVMAAVALAWLLACLRQCIPTVLTGTAIFLAFSDVASFDVFTSTYLKAVLTEASFIFPNTFQTITEIRQVSFFQILISATGSVEMGLVCLTGLVLFLIRHPILAIAYGPLVAFGLLNFVIGNRAIFYSAPIMWFGAAFLMTTTTRFVAARLSDKGYVLRRDQAATILAGSFAMIVAWVNSPTDYVPRPSFPKPVLEGLASLKTTVDPTNSVVVTWWDYGYASMLFNDLPTLHDGGSQTTPSTHFVASALLDADQISSIGNLKFLSTKGSEGIAAQANLASLRRQFDDALDEYSPDLYLVLSKQMTGWISSISKLSNWDIESGTPITPRGNNNGPIVFYEPLNCRLAGYPRLLNCTGANFNLEQGLINGVPELSSWAHSQDGVLVRRQDFENEGKFALQIVQTDNRINVFFLHQQLFESTFNELYHLGQIDHPLISLHYDDYPHIRIYKVNGDPNG